MNMYQRPNAYFYPLALEGSRNMYFPHLDIYKSGHDSGVTRHEMVKVNTSRKVDVISLSPTFVAKPDDKNDEPLTGRVTGCKLFGFSLTEEKASCQCSCKRSCIKVHKQGNLVVRAIDLTKLKGYNDLLIELERAFSMEGLLRYPVKGWRVLFTDDEDDMMVVGDDPWNEFCRTVSKIHICTQEEVQRMMSDDTQKLS